MAHACRCHRDRETTPGCSRTSSPTTRLETRPAASASATRRSTSSAAGRRPTTATATTSPAATSSHALGSSLRLRAPGVASYYDAGLNYRTGPSSFRAWGAGGCRHNGGCGGGGLPYRRGLAPSGPSLRWRFVGRAGAWGERGGGAGRIIVLDDPGGAFAVRWVLALLGWADANVFGARGAVARGVCSAWDGGRWALRRMGELDQPQA